MAEPLELIPPTFNHTLLSGEALIDNMEFRDALLRDFKTAKGGEMEGAGLFAAAHERGKEWLIVKGICDFADGNKKRGKVRNQTAAARSAVSLCCHVLARRSTFAALLCVPVSGATDKTTQASEDVVLFDIFKEGCRPYYLEREADHVVGQIVKSGSLWITGPSGCAKTNAALFSLITRGLPFHFIDLSRCVGSSVEQLFGAIHVEVASGLGLPAPKPLDPQTDQIICAIGDLFRAANGRSPIMMIDEIPLSDEQDFKDFVEVMCGLMIYLRNDGHRARFVLASVEDPTTRLQAIHLKVREQMSFVSLVAWTNPELEALLKLVLPALKISFSARERTQVVEGARGCPRRLKAILRHALLFSKDQAWSLDRIIRESQQSFAIHG